MIETQDDSCIDREDSGMDCPYLNSGEPQCSRRMNMQCLGSAYEMCTDEYEMCPVFLQLSGANYTPACSGIAVEIPSAVGVGLAVEGHVR